MTKTNSNKKKSCLPIKFFKWRPQQSNWRGRTGNSENKNGWGRGRKIRESVGGKPQQTRPKIFPSFSFFFLVFQILSGVLQVIKFQIFSSRNFSNQIKSMAKVWGAVRFVGVAVWCCESENYLSQFKVGADIRYTVPYIIVYFIFCFYLSFTKILRNQPIFFHSFRLKVSNGYKTNTI